MPTTYCLVEPRTALRSLMGGIAPPPAVETPPLIWVGTANYQSRGGVEPEFLVYHITDDLSFSNVKRWFQNRSSGASSHFVFDRDGTAYQFVGSANAAWTNGAVRKPSTHSPALTAAIRTGVNLNNFCITFEFIANRTSGVTEAQIAAAIDWARYYAKKYPKIKPTREHHLKHSDIDSVQRPYDPGEAFPLDQIIAAVAA